MVLSFTDAFANPTMREYYIGDSVTCVANTSRQQLCSYKWYKDNTMEVSSSEKLKPSDSGLYRCKAQCAIRGESCTFTAMVINVSTLPDPGKLRSLVIVSSIVRY